MRPTRGAAGLRAGTGQPCSEHPSCERGPDGVRSGRLALAIRSPTGRRPVAAEVLSDWATIEYDREAAGGSAPQAWNAQNVVRAASSPMRQACALGVRSMDITSFNSDGGSFNGMYRFLRHGSFGRLRSTLWQEWADRIHSEHREGPGFPIHPPLRKFACLALRLSLPWFHQSRPFQLRGITSPIECSMVVPSAAKTLSRFWIHPMWNCSTCLPQHGRCDIIFLAIPSSSSF